MAPLEPRDFQAPTKPSDPDSLILESWAQGYMVGSLIIMGAITIANMRRGIVLHKLILLELILGCFMGTFIFPHPPVYGWYLSATAVPLNISWLLHNAISWIKIKPFLSRRWSLVFISTVALACPYWVVEIYANFAYFNGSNDMFARTRPYEAIFRDPWWVFTTIFLFYQIATHYRTRVTTIVWISPRFGVLLSAMILSIIFIILDVLSVTHVFDSALPDGLNPFWKLSTVFKCLTDSIVLDDFKTALDRLMRHKLRREGIGRATIDCFGTFASTEPSSAGPKQNSFSTWKFLDTDRAQEDPLGEDSMERRMTNDSELNEAHIKAQCDRSKTTKSSPITIDEEAAISTSPKATHAPTIASTSTSETRTVPLEQVLRDGPPG